MLEGKIGFEAARLVTEVASPANEEQWVRRAEERTVVHLQEEVRAAGMLTRLGLNADAEPPSEAMMTALRELEVRVVTGADLAVRMRGRPGRCQKAVPASDDIGHKCADAPVKPGELVRCQDSASVAEATEHKCAGARASCDALARCSMEDCDHRVHAHVVFRSRGGSDEDENVTSLCLDCHLEGVHQGRITVTGSAPELAWVIGKNGHTVVEGRRRARDIFPVRR
jgi:hypothetical protein